VENQSQVPSAIPVGEGTLVITDETFLKGYQTGRLAFMSEGRAIRFSDKDLTTLIMKTLEDMSYSEPHCVGFVTGWLIAFASNTPQPIKNAEA